MARRRARARIVFHRERNPKVMPRHHPGLPSGHERFISPLMKEKKSAFVCQRNPANTTQFVPVYTS